MKRLSIVLALVLALFAVGVGGAALYLATLDDDGWRRILTYWLERETGERLTIAGDFSFTVSSHPALVAENVRLDAGEPSKPTPILSLGRIELIASLPDLFRRIVHIERLRIKDATLHIRLAPQEHRPEATGNAERRPIPLLLSDLTLEHVRVMVHPAGGRRSTRLSLDRFTFRPPDLAPCR